MYKYTQFFTNIEYIDSVLYPERRGFSEKLRKELGMSREAPHSWRKRGVIPHRNSLARISQTVSRLLSEKFLREIDISPETLRDGNIKEVINTALKKTKYRIPLVPAASAHDIRGIYKTKGVSSKNIPIDDSQSLTEGLLAFIHSPEWKLAQVNQDEFLHLKSISFPENTKTVKEHYIQYLIYFRNVIVKSNQQK